MHELLLCVISMLSSNGIAILLQLRHLFIPDSSNSGPACNVCTCTFEFSICITCITL